jgi:Mannosyltransferase putative
MFLDGNAIPMVDPEELFSRGAYARDGYLMWSDLWFSTRVAHEYAVYSLLQVKSLEDSRVDIQVRPISRRRHCCCRRRSVPLAQDRVCCMPVRQRRDGTVHNPLLGSGGSA